MQRTEVPVLAATSAVGIDDAATSSQRFHPKRGTGEASRLTGRHSSRDVRGTPGGAI